MNTPDLISMVHGMSGNMYIIILCLALLLLCGHHAYASRASSMSCSVIIVSDCALSICMLYSLLLCDDHFVCVICDSPSKNQPSSHF